MVDQEKTFSSEHVPERPMIFHSAVTMRGQKLDDFSQRLLAHLEIGNRFAISDNGWFAAASREPLHRATKR